MRVLYARVGRTFCRNCGREVVRETAEVVSRQLAELPSGTRLLLGFGLPVVDAPPSTNGDVVEVDEMTEAPDVEGELPGLRPPSVDPVPGDRGPLQQPKSEQHTRTISATVATLRKKGFARLLIDGGAVSFDDVDPAALMDRSTLQVVVDRVQLTGEDLRQRLTDSIETAYLEGGGAAWTVQLPSSDPPTASPVTHDFSERFECRQCGIMYEDPQPRLFSFNNPFGACPTCHGFGNIIELDMDLVVPDRTKSIQQGAVEPWSKPHYRAQLAELKRAARKAKLRLDVPWSDLTDQERHFVVEGGGADTEYEGIRGFFRWLERKKYKVHV